MDTTARLDSVQIPVAPDLVVSGVLATPEWWPTGTRVAVVLAHDSGADMSAPLLVALQQGLAERGSLTLRFNFPWVEAGKRRPDAPALLEKTLRQALASLMVDPQNAPARVVLVGCGLGARVAANVLALGLKADGLACLSYPLHPAGRPTQLRAEPLFRIICPVLFVQGTRDPTCRVDRLQLVLRRIGAPTDLHVVEDADHHLHVIKRSGRTQEDVHREVLEVLNRFALYASRSP